MKGTLQRIKEGWSVINDETTETHLVYPPETKHPNVVTFYEGKQVEYTLVQTLKPDAVFTTEKGWNIDPVDKIYASVISDGLNETWEEIEEEYLKDEYPVFGGPFTDALEPFEWLKIYYNPPTRKK